jgi:hypothetical protein
MTNPSIWVPAPPARLGAQRQAPEAGEDALAGERAVGHRVREDLDHAAAGSDRRSRSSSCRLAAT